jgi:hypothetical protein
VLGVGLRRQLEASLELALESLAEPECFLLLLLRLSALTFDGELVVGDLDPELLLIGTSVRSPIVGNYRSVQSGQPSSAGPANGLLATTVCVAYSKWQHGTFSVALAWCSAFLLSVHRVERLRGRL